MTDPLTIINDIYPPGSTASRILLAHSRRVRRKALEVAQRLAHLDPDTAFIAEAAMLHDIGIFQTASPAIGCRGDEPYVRHGIIGRKVLEAYGLPRHGLVCERHIGAGILKSDVEAQGLPLPLRDMLPTTLEEKIICYADTFFSKTDGGKEHPLDKVLEDLSRFGQDQVDRFLQWHRLFEMGVE